MKIGRRYRTVIPRGTLELDNYQCSGNIWHLSTMATAIIGKLKKMLALTSRLGRIYKVRFDITVKDEPDD